MKSTKYEFKDVQYMTAKDKELVLKQWTTFIRKLAEGTMTFDHFTSRIYDHLNQHCSFIAWYSRSGFFSHYFETPEDTLEFLGQFDLKQGGVSVEYGDKWWIEGDYADLNHAMCDAVKEYKDRIYPRLNSKARSDDIQDARRLLAKHGIKLELKKLKGGKEDDDKHEYELMELDDDQKTVLLRALDYTVKDGLVCDKEGKPIVCKYTDRPVTLKECALFGGFPPFNGDALGVASFLTENPEIRFKDDEMEEEG